MNKKQLEYIYPGTVVTMGKKDTFSLSYKGETVTYDPKSHPWCYWCYKNHQFLDWHTVKNIIDKK